jgi:hypothetical protein
VKWVHLAQDRDQWQAVVNKVMKLRVPYKEGNFLADLLLASQELFQSMELDGLLVS